MANFSDDPYDLLEDEEESQNDADESDVDDPAGDLSNPSTSSQGESNPFGGSASTPTGENSEEALEDFIGEAPIAGKPFSIADEVEKDERAKYDIPPEGADVPDPLGKVPSKLDELDEPSEEDLEEIEIEEMFGDKD